MGQREYKVENLILNGDSFTKKFSEEVVNGSICIMMRDIIFEVELLGIIN